MIQKKIVTGLEKLGDFLKRRGRHRMIYRDPGEPYLERFYILSTPWLGIYVHRFWASDEDGLHDHPWNSASIILAHSYFEDVPLYRKNPYGPVVTKKRSPLRPPITIRSKLAAHRITVPEGAEGTCWSLFIRFGLKRRKWGFYRNGRWEPALVQRRKDEINN
jgi:hypothetical protein